MCDDSEGVPILRSGSPNYTPQGYGFSQRDVTNTPETHRKQSRGSVRKADTAAEEPAEPRQGRNPSTGQPTPDLEDRAGQAKTPRCSNNFVLFFFVYERQPTETEQMSVTVKGHLRRYQSGHKVWIDRHERSDRSSGYEQHQRSSEDELISARYQRARRWFGLPPK